MDVFNNGTKAPAEAWINRISIPFLRWSWNAWNKFRDPDFSINVSYANGQNFDLASLSAFFNIVKSLDNLEVSIRYSLFNSKRKNK